MVYVERLPEEQQMTSGLFLPTKEQPRMHVCKVHLQYSSRSSLRDAEDPCTFMPLSYQRMM